MSTPDVWYRIFDKLWADKIVLKPVTKIESKQVKTTSKISVKLGPKK